ncbi:MAG: FG-GAP repeat protein [Planctomycetota bacterium]
MILALPLLVAAVQSPVANGLPGDLEWVDAVDAPATEGGDQFGRAVAAGGERAVIGAWRRAGNTGGADVYRWEGGQLVHEAILSPSDGFPGSMCATDVAIDDAGEIVVLSALGDSTQGQSAGAVYVFRRTATGWAEDAKLFAPDASPNDGFGAAVAAGGDVIVVGARTVDVAPSFFQAGAVYVFERNGAGWDAGTRFTAPDLDIGDRFGETLALDGDSFAVGVAAKDNEFGDNAGAVYVYSRGPSGWSLDARVVPPGLAAGESFGRTVALSGNRLLASSNVVGGPAMSGAVHAFSRASGAWVEVDRFRSPVPSAFDFFGEALALDGRRALVASREGDDPTRTAVHVYRLGWTGADWTQTLEQSVPAGAHVFNGSDVDLTGDFALVGAALHAAMVGADPGFADVYRIESLIDRARTPRRTRR